MNRRRPGIRRAYLAVGLGGLALVVSALGVVAPPARITWTPGTARVSLVAFAVLGAGLVMAGLASLDGLLGPATPGGFRDNDLAAVATCFGVLALVFAYASYRSMRR
jgi:hypothetical protein